MAKGSKLGVKRGSYKTNSILNTGYQFNPLLTLFIVFKILNLKTYNEIEQYINNKIKFYKTKFNYNKENYNLDLNSINSFISSYRNDVLTNYSRNDKNLIIDVLKNNQDGNFLNTEMNIEDLDKIITKMFYNILKRYTKDKNIDIENYESEDLVKIVKTKTNLYNQFLLDFKKSMTSNYLIFLKENFGKFAFNIYFRYNVNFTNKTPKNFTFENLIESFIIILGSENYNSLPIKKSFFEFKPKNMEDEYIHNKFLDLCQIYVEFKLQNIYLLDY